MRYAHIGTNISAVEVTDISPFGIWLMYRGQEYFLGYKHFPWFLEAPVQKVFSVVEEAEGHLRWPDLDVDLYIDSIQDPGAFPMVFRRATSLEPKDDSVNQ